MERFLVWLLTRIGTPLPVPGENPPSTDTKGLHLALSVDLLCQTDEYYDQGT